MASETLFIQALKQAPVPRTPVWIMRQAGRYLPEYRTVRAKAKDFLSLCKTPALAKEVTLQPLRRFELDAAIVFSDILTIPDALDLGLHFIEGEGPVFDKPLQDTARLSAFPIDQVISRLDYVMETVTAVKSALPQDIPLIGFSGSPWTLACYMVEGRGSRTFSKLLRWMYAEPKEVCVLLEWLTEAVSQYLCAQIQAGADVVMLFDTWGGLLSPEHYALFSKPFLKSIVQRVKTANPEAPTIVFSKGVQDFHLLLDIGADAIGLDWTMDLAKARKTVQGKVALQGNLDPAVLLTNKETIEKEVQRVLAAYGKGSGHIFNLGHGITPDVPPEHVQCMIDAVKKWSPSYHE